MTLKLSADELSALLGQQHPHSRGLLSRIFQCSCAIGGTAGLAHIGCIATPLSMTLAAGSPALSSLLPHINDQMMLGMSTLFSAAGVGTWWLMRGRKAGTIERGLTAGGAALGLCFTLAMHGALPINNSNHIHSESSAESPHPQRLSDLDKDAQIYARSLMNETHISEQYAVRLAQDICGKNTKVEP